MPQKYKTFPYFCGKFATFLIMAHYFRKYTFSWLIIGIIIYLSFFTPPKTELDNISNIDKLAHICMYGGLCSILWIEYLRSHIQINRIRAFIGGIVLPIAFSGIIELLQEYATTNRSGDWADMIANSIGVILAALLGQFIFPRWVKKSRN
jgi:VanZ family protein